MTEAKKGKLGLIFITFTQDSAGSKYLYRLALRISTCLIAEAGGLAMKWCLHIKHAVFSWMSCFFEVTGRGMLMVRAGFWLKTCPLNLPFEISRNLDIVAKVINILGFGFHLHRCH